MRQSGSAATPCLIIPTHGPTVTMLSNATELGPAATEDSQVLELGHPIGDTTTMDLAFTIWRTTEFEAMVPSSKSTQMDLLRLGRGNAPGRWLVQPTNGSSTNSPGFRALGYDDVRYLSSFWQSFLLLYNNLIVPGISLSTPTPDSSGTLVMATTWFAKEKPTPSASRWMGARLRRLPVALAANNDGG